MSSHTHSASSSGATGRRADPAGDPRVSPPDRHRPSRWEGDLGTDTALFPAPWLPAGTSLRC